MKKQRLNANGIFLMWIAAILMVGMLAMTGCVSETVRGVGSLLDGAGHVLQGMGSDLQQGADGYDSKSKE